MDIKEIIKERKLAMLEDNRNLSRNQAILSAQLQQTNRQIAKLEIELEVLIEWESKLKEDDNAGFEHSDGGE